MLFFRFRIVIQIEIRFSDLKSFCLSSAKKFSLITDLITIFFWDSIQLDYAIPSIETEKESKLSVCSIKQSMSQIFLDIHFFSKGNFASPRLNRAFIMIYIARLVFPLCTRNSSWLHGPVCVKHAIKWIICPDGCQGILQETVWQVIYVRSTSQTQWDFPVIISLH